MAELKRRSTAWRVTAASVLTLVLAVVGFHYRPAYGQRAPEPKEVPVPVVNEGATLAATVSFPRGAGPFPGVVLVHGSGRTTRDQQRMQRDRFLSAGFAVLSYDKRGVGESTGEYDDVGVRTSPERMPLLGRDALTCLRALKGQRRIDGARVGFFGPSQAGWIIPAAIGAAPAGEVAFAVIFSGPATSVGLEYAYSEATGDGIRAHDALTPEQIDARVDAYKGPSGFDTAPMLRALKTPTLWLLGDADESIPIRHTERNLRALIAAGVPITLRIYPGGNHALFGPSGPIAWWVDVEKWLRANRILQ